MAIDPLDGNDDEWSEERERHTEHLVQFDTTDRQVKEGAVLTVSTLAVVLLCGYGSLGTSYDPEARTFVEALGDPLPTSLQTACQWSLVIMVPVCLYFMHQTLSFMLKRQRLGRAIRAHEAQQAQR